ncbi:hypothetical protein LEP1GSC037_2038 [Leptospira interrogans str. 2006001854]|uniref:Uncharacterized protein n=2 Tax=Leptospira interrogans TaxID=173 RepID=N1UKN2_LEPIR|nr:hypothetical protein LEP1GSC037_2038 [Leptospira interrogans str. 2006001854]EMY25442.1 hypothetical protein LEP1GSC115_5759 [Leptospira interrogans serovar Australis str. 200703203]
MNPWILYTEFTFIKTFSISIAESRKNKNPEDLEIRRVLLIQRRFKIGISLLR